MALFHLRAYILVLGLATLMSACAPSKPGESGGAELSAPQPTTKPLAKPSREEKPMIQTDKIPAELMQKLKNDVFEKSGVAANSLTVVRAEPVTWSDGSLGCPKPGMVYTQALVDGYWVVFRAGNTQFDYRASQSGHFTRCLESDSKPPIRHQDI